MFSTILDRAYLPTKLVHYLQQNIFKFRVI
jgi:hypothetical protein